MNPTKKSLFPYYKKVDLSTREIRRTYVFDNELSVTIEGPQFVIVSDNGHRLMDANGVSHYIPYDWIHLFWENKGDRSFYCEDKNKDQVAEKNSPEQDS